MPNILINFFNMDGYGHFIWGSYGLSIVVIICLLLHSYYFLKSTEAKLKLLTKKANKNET
jgi:heme exporter protein CcmD